jgi:F0F1-type ATP synthase membrane subunit b/b'
MPIDDGLALESELMQELLQSEEALERMRNYVSTGQKGARERIEEEKQEIERQWQEKHGKR